MIERNFQEESNQFTVFSDSFRVVELYKDLFFLEPISAYPIGLWNRHLDSLLKELGKTHLDCIYALYDSSGQINLSANELRLGKLAAFSEIKRSRHFDLILCLVRQYEESYFCRFSDSICTRCQRSKTRDAMLAPICPMSFLRLESQRIADNAVGDLVLEGIDDDTADIGDELNEIEIRRVLDYFGVSPSTLPNDKISYDGTLAGLPVIVWRYRLEFDYAAAESLSDLANDRPLLILVNQMYLTEEPQDLLNISVLKYSNDVITPQITAITSTAKLDELVIP